MNHHTGGREPTALEQERWDSWMFEMEKIAASLHCTGLTFSHFINMATLAWRITGQRVELSLQDVTNPKEPTQ